MNGLAVRDRSGVAAQRKAAALLKGALRYGLLLLPPLLLLPDIGGFPYPSDQALFSDLAITHYPNAVYLLQAVREWGMVPLWSPSILSGTPFAANPLSGLWYPPGWVALLFPLPLGFNLLVGLHLLWGGIGMYRLLRMEELSHPAALFGALSFEGMPKLFAHYGAGHLTLLYALAWTPWLLLFWERGNGTRVEKGRPVSEKDKIWILGRLPAGAVLALVFVADPRWAAYAGGLWWGYALAHSQKRVRALINLAAQTALAGLLAAPLGLPLLEYTRLSSRANLAAQEALTLSLPPARLLGLLFPDLGGFHEWALYPGAAVLALALAALLAKARPGKVRFWLWLALLAGLLALGDGTPLGGLLARLPGLSLLRVPARALFLSGMALAALGAHGLVGILNGDAIASAKRVRIGLVALAGAALALGAGVLVLAGRLPVSFAWGMAAAPAAAVWTLVGLRREKTVSQSVWLAGIFALILVDLGGASSRAFEMRNAQRVLAEGSAAAEYLSGEPDAGRVYSPSYSLPQHTAASYGLELADGVDPLQLERYAAFMESASCVPRAGYSVTVPPFETGDPSVDNAAYRPDPAALGRLNVKWVAAEYDLPVQGLALRARFGKTRLYENLQARPRAWVQPAGGQGSETFRAAEILEWQPNRIQILAEGPGRLVLSELAYPGWRAAVDGQAARIETVEGLLRGVALGPGRHAVVFTFRPANVYLGMAFFGLGCAGLLSQLFRHARTTSD